MAVVGAGAVEGRVGGERAVAGAQTVVGAVEGAGPGEAHNKRSRRSSRIFDLPRPARAVTTLMSQSCLGESLGCTWQREAGGGYEAGVVVGEGVKELARE